MRDYTPADVDSLADKLDALELSSGERAALDALLDAAATDEVAGFAFEPIGSSHDSFANQEISYFRPRLRSVIGGLPGDYIGETEKQ